MRAHALLLILTTLIAVAACGNDAGGNVGASRASGANNDDLGALDVASILDFLNSRNATFTTLTNDAHVQARAARNIVDHVSGADHLLATSDDHPFHSIAQLDAVKYVGPATIRAIESYVTTHAQPVDLTVEGVDLSAENAAQIVALTNSATAQLLDDDVGLDSRAAANLVAARPLADILAVAAVSYVGTNALTKLRDYVQAHPVATDGTPPAVTPIPYVLQWINDYQGTGGHVTRLNLLRTGEYQATVAGVQETGVFFGPTEVPTTPGIALRLLSSTGRGWSADLTLYQSQDAIVARDGTQSTLHATLPTDGEDTCDNAASTGATYLDDDANSDGLYCSCETGSWIPAMGGCVP